MKMTEPKPRAAALRDPVHAASSRSRLTALIVACALLMQNLDSTVLATALPAMARGFGEDPVRMNIALTSYLLSLAVFIPASGWMADRFGARRIFRAAILVFTLGSVLCGRAPNLGFLVGARILQGLGGAMMVPVGRLLLLRTVQKSELVAAMAWLTMPALVGPIAGPPLGGFIVTYWDWRWIFYINVPIGLAGILLVTWFIAEVREPRPDPFDGVGLVFSGISLSCLMFALEFFGRSVMPTAFTATLFGAGLVAGAAYLRHARRHPKPILDLTLFQIPTFGVSVLAGSLFRLGIGALPFLLPLLIQIGFEETAAQSGMITFASAAGALVMKPATQGLLRWIGFRPTLLWNGALSAVLLSVCAAFRPGWPLWAIYAVLLLGGLVRSLQFTAYNSIAFADIPRERMSAASSLYSTFQQLSLTLGIALGAAALEFASWAGGHARPTLGDFTFAFLVVGIASGLAAPCALLLPPEAGEELAGRAAPKAAE
jgi:EmrB/QacA subfamily drug resistance transporter